MFAKVNSIGIFGMETYMVEVEADLSQGLPRFDIVGLPDTSVSESRDRVRAAVKNCGFTFPVSRITVNLAPADTRKEGALYDLPVFVALLLASKQLQADLDGCAFIGELSLDGMLRRVDGALPMVIRARDEGMKAVFVPAANAAECSVVQSVAVYPLESVFRLTQHLKGENPVEPVKSGDFGDYAMPDDLPDFRDVRGQREAKRALEVAAAGGHNVMMIGPPGSGKSMLAKRLASILPEMTFEESLETTKLYSIAGLLPPNISLMKARPFRSPHHTVSPAGLSGGGAVPRPGEISLAHNGVLFLDELPEFSRTAMEVMRQPVEDGVITIARVAGTLTFPCSVMLVCAMNPCPCGYFGHPKRECTCPPGAAAKYLAKVSGPLLDRLDIHVEIPPVEFEKLTGEQGGESSADIRRRVNAARKRQQERFEGTGIACNARMTPAQTKQLCRPDAAALKLLGQAFEKFGFSARAYDKVLRVARTLADLDGSETIEANHIAEAVQYRSLDRKFWKT